MFRIADRTGLIAPSPTLALDAKVKQMQAEGHDIINYGVGEPDFETPAHIKEAAVKAIRDGFTRYTAVDGIIELKRAVADKFAVDNGLSYETDQIVISNGGKHSLYNTFQVLFQAGDEVIIPAPYWVTYPPQIILAGAKPVIVNTESENNFRLTPQALEAAITPRTKGLILNSPSNPTGGVYDRQSLEALAEVVIKHDLWVISDDMYEKIVFDGFKFCNMAMLGPELYERTIITHGLSKTYAMTGWRLGFLAGPREVARAAAKFQSQSTANACSITQKAAVAALSGPQDEVAKMVECFDRRRRLTVAALNEIPGLRCPSPTGAFYVFPDIRDFIGKITPRGEKITGSGDLANYLLAQARVAISPGAAFGEDDALRLSYAMSDEDNTRGLYRMKEALNALR